MEAGKKERFTIESSAEAHAALNATAKEYKLTQGEILELIFSNIDMEKALGPKFRAARRAKVAARDQRKRISKALEHLSDDELQRIMQERAGRTE